MKQIIGRKMGMSQVYGEDGTMYAVTVVEVLPNVITQKKLKEKEGYDAIQVGYEDKKEKSLNKCEKGIFSKANVSPKANLFELQGDELASYEVGQEITCDIFQAGDQVDVIGTSKGRGFAGVIKRWGHKIGPKAHGSGFHRQMGSFANNGRCNNRVIPGKKMAGHMGDQSATVLNCVIIAVNKELNYILVTGGIPGPKKGLIKIRSAIKPLKYPMKPSPVMDREKLEAERQAKLEAEAKVKEEAKAKKLAEEAAKKAAKEEAIAKANAERQQAAALKAQEESKAETEANAEVKVEDKKSE